MKQFEVLLAIRFRYHSLPEAVVWYYTVCFAIAANIATSRAYGIVQCQHISFTKQTAFA